MSSRREAAVIVLWYCICFSQHWVPDLQVSMGPFDPHNPSKFSMTSYAQFNNHPMNLLVHHHCAWKLPKKWLLFPSWMEKNKTYHPYHHWIGASLRESKLILTPMDRGSKVVLGSEGQRITGSIGPEPISMELWGPPTINRYHWRIFSTPKYLVFFLEGPYWNHWWEGAHLLDRSQGSWHRATCMKKLMLQLEKTNENSVKSWSIRYMSLQPFP